MKKRELIEKIQTLKIEVETERQYHEFEEQRAKRLEKQLLESQKELTKLKPAKKYHIIWEDNSKLIEAESFTVVQDNYVFYNKDDNVIYYANKMDVKAIEVQNA